MDFLSSRWLTVVEVIFRLNKIKNGIPFTNNMSDVINTSLWSLMSSLVNLTISPAAWVDFFLVVFPFKATFPPPDSMCNVNILYRHRTVYDFSALENLKMIWWTWFYWPYILYDLLNSFVINFLNVICSYRPNNSSGRFVELSSTRLWIASYHNLTPLFPLRHRAWFKYFNDFLVSTFWLLFDNV